MSEKKPVHFHLYDPSSGLHLFGKPKASEPTQYQYVNCSNCDNCSLHKIGQCAAVPVLFSGHCPYGEYRRVHGPTKRAKSFYSWQLEAREQFKGVPYLKAPTAKLAIVGDFIYIPYSHVNMNKDLPFDKHGGFMMTGTNFLRMSDFNIETIQKILDFYPQALFGGEIRSYQTEEMPKFLNHLQELFFDLYGRLLEARPDYIQKYGLNKPKNYVGRKALTKTINPCRFTTEGYKGNYKVTWTWDGKILTTSLKDGGEHVVSSWAGLKDYTEAVVTLTPGDDTVTIITENSQVNDKTVFVD